MSTLTNGIQSMSVSVSSNQQNSTVMKSERQLTEAPVNVRFGI